MLVFVTKASDDYWHDFKEVNTLDDLMEIHDRIIIEKNDFYNNLINERLEKFFTNFWKDFKKEDIPKVVSAKYEVIIYDDWVE